MHYGLPNRPAPDIQHPHKAAHDWHADLVPPQVLENFNHIDVTAPIKRQTTLVPGRYTTANP
jgi:hypothetical protein